MQIDRSFIDGDIRGAIAYMRAHEQFADVLPAYAALFENAEYRTYDVPDGINDILRRYQIYLRDTFYCGVPEAEAADRLLAGLRALTGLPEADEAALAGRLGVTVRGGGLSCAVRQNAGILRSVYLAGHRPDGLPRRAAGRRGGIYRQHPERLRVPGGGWTI